MKMSVAKVLVLVIFLSVLVIPIQTGPGQGNNP